MDSLALLELVTVVVAAGVSFVVSASAGLGGSLLLVPVLVLILGPQKGVALAALLLGGNNVLKVIAYWHTIPFRAAAMIILLIATGAALGATAMVHAPSGMVAAGVLVSFLATLVMERKGFTLGRTVFAPVLAFASGATSGFSGTSGPLKGAAIRNLDVDRTHFAGTASAASLAGDLTKTTVFAHAQLLDDRALTILVVALPLMLLGTLSGFRLNRQLGERGFAIFFWIVMAGYGVRLLISI
jgi:hypothetical protein